jgi:hypothetical protein
MFDFPSLSTPSNLLFYRNLLSTSYASFFLSILSILTPQALTRVKLWVGSLTVAVAYT